MVRLLLAHGANPDWTKGSLSCGGTTLHEAIALGCPDEILELLLDARAARDFLDRDGRTPLAFAVRLGAVSAERILRGRGADDAQVAPVDRWVGACFQEDEHAAATLLRERFELTRAEHQLVPRAIRSGKPLAVRLLLAGGARPDVPDDDGQSALHLAAARADTALCALLLDQGAPLEARNFDEKTPLECAQTHAATRAFLLARGAREAASEADAGERAERFERAADCVVSGDLEELRTLLARDPDLVRARSPRPHRATLLHYAAANGVEAARQRTPPNAVEVVQLLLDAGSDPDALCFTFRGGPEQTMLGLLTTSGHPVKAGLLLPLVATMLRAGAHASPRYELLVDLREACAAGRSHSIALDPASERAELALTDAARLGELELVRDLLDRGVHVDAAPENRITALHQAAFSGNAKLCEHLLELGADLGARDALYNGVPAGWAEAGGHPELARSLADRARATHKEESR
jgi:ankyrin repeat protein